jgi:hypothetical protein
MFRHLMLLPLLWLLGGCQGPQVQHDFDPQRDFSAYRSWDWKEPALRHRPDDPRLHSDLTEQRLRSAVSEQLEQRGLRKAGAASEADLHVQAWLIVDERTQQFTSASGGAWGGMWGGPMFVDTRTLHYRVGTLQLDFYAADDGKLVWRGSAEQVLRDNPGSPEARAASLRERVDEILNHYPPR